MLLALCGVFCSHITSSYFCFPDLALGQQLDCSTHYRKLLLSPKQAPARGGWISERVGYTMKAPRTPTASGVSLKFNRLKNGPRTPSANRLAPSAAAAAQSTKAAKQAAPFSQSTRAWRSGGDRKIMFDNRGERERERYCGSLSLPLVGLVVWRVYNLAVRQQVLSACCMI